MSSDYQLEDTIYLPFTTRAFATGIPTALVSGVVDIYENVTAAPIITAETLTVSLNGRAGFNVITVTATAASGFEVGGSYTAILDAGTVDSVSVIGEVVAHFTLDGSAAAQDLANATDGLGALRTLTLDVPTVAEFDARTLLAASYFDPSADTVANVTTVATLTGHIAQTGDSFARLGAPAGASVSADILVIDDFVDALETRIPDVISLAAINAEVDTALVDINLDHLLATAVAIPAIVAGTFLDQIMDDGTATFDRTTDSLQAIRDTAPLGTAMRGTDSASTHSAADVWTSATRTLTALGFTLAASDASWVDVNDRVDVGRFISIAVAAATASGEVAANVTEWLATPVTAATVGRPDVNTAAINDAVVVGDGNITPWDGA